MRKYQPESKFSNAGYFVKIIFPSNTAKLLDIFRFQYFQNKKSQSKIDWIKQLLPADFEKINQVVLKIIFDLDNIEGNTCRAQILIRTTI